MSTSTLSTTAPARKRRGRLAVAIVSGVMALTAGGTYVGYRLAFHKNLKAMREIRAAEQQQQALDQAFGSPANP